MEEQDKTSKEKKMRERMIFIAGVAAGIIISFTISGIVTKLINKIK